MNEIKLLKVKMQCFHVDENNIWFVPEEAGVLCKYDLLAKQIVLMRIIPGDMAREYAYSAIVKYENKLVLIPCVAEKIVVYDMDMEVFREIELPDHKEAQLSHIKFIYGFGKGYFIYLIPGSYPYFIRIDMRNFEVFQSGNVAQACKDFFNISNTKVNFSASAWDGGNTIYSAITVSDEKRTQVCLGKIQLPSFQFNIQKPGCVEKEIKGMIWHKGHLFLYSAEENILVLDQNMKMLKCISADTIQVDDDSEEKWVALARICICEDEMYFIRRSKQEAVILDLRDGYTVSNRKLIGEWIRYAGNTSHGILIQSQEKSYFYLKKSGTFAKYYFETERKVIQSCYQKVVTANKECVHEDEIFQVSEWKALVSVSMEQGRNRKNSGKEIYQCIMNDFGG